MKEKKIYIGTDLFFAFLSLSINLLNEMFRTPGLSGEAGAALGVA